VGILRIDVVDQCESASKEKCSQARWHIGCNVVIKWQDDDGNKTESHVDIGTSNASMPSDGNNPKTDRTG
jgi:hypothetical protein